jgi:hypothetical protein
LAGDDGFTDFSTVLQDMKNEEILFQSKKKRKALRQAAAEEAADKQAENMEEGGIMSGEGRAGVESVNGVKFY